MNFSYIGGFDFIVSHARHLGFQQKESTSQAVMRISYFFIPTWYGYLMVFTFLIPFRYIYHARICKHRSIILVPICIRMVPTQIIILVYKDSLASR